MADISSGKRNEPIPEVQGNILPEYIMREFKLSMWIPSELAGKVIGKQGVSISHIEQQAKARTIKPLPAVGDSLWTAFAIIGEWNSIIAAYKAISDVVNGEVDDVVLEYTINYRKRFFLYGKHALQIIKTISARSNVRIFYPEFNIKVQTYKDAVPMTLEGSYENVLKAVALLEQEAILYVEHQKALQKAEEEREAKRERDVQNKASGAKKENSGPSSTEDGKWSKAVVPVILERKPNNGVNGSTKAGTSGGPPSTEDGHHKKKPDEVSSTPPAASTKTPVVRGTSALADKALGAITKSTPPATIPSTSTNVASSSSQPQSTAETVAAAAPVQPANKTKPVVPFVTTIVPHPGPTPPLVTLPNGSFSQVIHVPSSIVGLLLSKKSFVRVSIMNQIQHSTGTYISKVGDKKGGRKQQKTATTAATISTAKTTKKGDLKPRRRRQSVSDSEEGEEEGSDSDDGDDSDDEEDDSDDEDEEESVSVEAEVKEDPNKKASHDSEFIDFVIVGTPSAQVTVAYTMLDRIIRGEHIKDVMETLPKPPRATSSNKKDAGLTRGSNGSKRKEKEPKERKERSHSHSEKTAPKRAGEEDGANKNKASESSTVGPPAVVVLGSDPAKRESNLRQRGEGRQSRNVRVVSEAESSNKVDTKAPTENKAEKSEKEPKRAENSRAESLLVAGREKAAERDAAAVAAGGGEGRGAGGRGGAGRGRGSGGRGRGREGRGGAKSDK